ncbi:MAG: hypothetical protein KF732_05690 [Flavobacteriales bacterium]|nr:hypothetical protein [Flavobacteriales bacterium]
MMKYEFLLLTMLFFPSLLFCQDTTQDTIIVVGNNPKYIYSYKGIIYGGLHYKLPKGTYYAYDTKSKYKNKISFEDERITAKKYRGNLIRISSYGEDSLLTGITKHFRYNYKTNKDECYSLQHFEKGLLNGFEIEYNTTGSIRSIGKNLNGKKHGVWFYINENPFSVTEIEYDNDVIIKRSEN